MKLKIKNLITVALGIIAVILAVMAYMAVKKIDTQPPVLEITNAEYVFVQGQDEQLLLNAVAAKDAIDGDVSDLIRIEKTSITNNNAFIRVTFAAKDRSNNVTKKTFQFAYALDPNAPAEQEKPSDRTYNIVLVNNLGVENLATSYAVLLQRQGHRIVNVGLSNDQPSPGTVIYVTNEGEGNELLDIFPNATIVVGNISNRLNVNSTGADTFIVLGYQHSIVPEI